MVTLHDEQYRMVLFTQTVTIFFFFRSDSDHLRCEEKEKRR